MQDKIWISDLNQRKEVQAGFNRSRPVRFYDTTLRDGEQSPGASMTREEKVRIATMLEKMHVDVIEAGFAIASPGDFEAVKAVAEVVKEDNVFPMIPAGASLSEMLIEKPKHRLEKPSGST